MQRPVSNPPNPWASAHVEWLEPPPPVAVQVYEEHSRSIVADNDSPDVPFRWSVNPYRGCQHACAYCYARPYHQYLGFGAGTDFDSKIVVKVDAPALLAAHFAKKSWKGDEIAFSGVTDCYQPLEASYALTRGCLAACLAAGNPAGVITKGALVRRDIDLLCKLAERGLAQVFVSIPFADPAMARAMEPWAGTPRTRFETLRVLSDAGVPTGVSVAPMIPGLNDDQSPEILAQARAAGATRAFLTMLRLPAEVAPVFEERLRAAFPLRADKVLHAVREMRGGALYANGFGERMRGEGPRWQAVRELFDLTARRLGFEGRWRAKPGRADADELEALRMRAARDDRPRQGELFGS